MKHLVEPGFLAPEHLKQLARLEERRGIADYQADEEIGIEQAGSLVADAQNFLTAARSLLDTLPR